MSPRQRSKQGDRPVTLLILEGDTEVIFYGRVRDARLNGIKVELRNMKGQGNTNKDVLAELFKYCRNNPADLVRAYCCIDTERDKASATPLDLEVIKEKVTQNRNLKNILSVSSILADPEIESWFFYDIAGIYKYLGTKKTARKPKKYQRVSSFAKKDLQLLFSGSNRAYVAGKRASHLISSLDIEKIIKNCDELSKGVNLILEKADDNSNELFR